MKRRCLNANDDAYANYGARGITVCERWRDSFEAFVADMGRMPSTGHTLERVDNNRGYEPGNCRWATKAEQSRNRRTNRLREDDVQAIRDRLARGERPGAIADDFKVSSSLIYRIMRGGWARST